MPEVKTRKIQPVITEQAYNTLRYLGAVERATMTAIIERAIREYAEHHCPEALEQQ